MTSVEKKCRLRKLTFVSLAAAITAGALCAGMGTGSAATAGPDVQTSSGYDWKVTNFTKKPLTQVDFTKWDQGSDGRRGWPSNIKAATLAPGAKADGHLDDTVDWDIAARNRTSGSLCYDGTRWELPEQTTKYEKWRGVYIYVTDNGHGGDQLFATPEGAYDNRGLVPHGACIPA
ncbi:hypothetical protein R3Q06_30565 [Rhodococcus erythropolis]|uniref:hypothetical protein n=1 Tax=Rhodococcus erythropolis TaxID=1833 RepID=UPI002949A758|nr:hypothetical protein [Rhodococcus erythropolis]MDV6277839.1 hypothetical protein [Rhodococcus erythropolis]